MSSSGDKKPSEEGVNHFNIPVKKITDPSYYLDQSYLDNLDESQKQLDKSGAVKKTGKSDEKPVQWIEASGMSQSNLVIGFDEDMPNSWIAVFINIAIFIALLVINVAVHSIFSNPVLIGIMTGSAFLMSGSVVLTAMALYLDPNEDKASSLFSRIKSKINISHLLCFAGCTTTLGVGILYITINVLSPGIVTRFLAQNYLLLIGAVAVASILLSLLGKWIEIHNHEKNQENQTNQIKDLADVKVVQVSLQKKTGLEREKKEEKGMSGKVQDAQTQEKAIISNT